MWLGTNAVHQQERLSRSPRDIKGERRRGACVSGWLKLHKSSVKVDSPPELVLVCVRKGEIWPPSVKSCAVAIAIAQLVGVCWVCGRTEKQNYCLSCSVADLRQASTPALGEP